MPQILSNDSWTSQWLLPTHEPMFFYFFLVFFSSPLFLPPSLWQETVWLGSLQAMPFIHWQLRMYRRNRATSKPQLHEGWPGRQGNAVALIPGSLTSVGYNFLGWHQILRHRNACHASCCIQTNQSSRVQTGGMPKRPMILFEGSFCGRSFDKHSR